MQTDDVTDDRRLPLEFDEGYNIQVAVVFNNHCGEYISMTGPVDSIGNFWGVVGIVYHALDVIKDDDLTLDEKRLRVMLRGRFGEELGL